MKPEEPRFWTLADELVATGTIVIDRPRGSAHPRLPTVIYPLDYGYLAGTTGGDGEGIDIWRGSTGDGRVVAVIATVDVLKRDAEVKLLIACTEDECRLALATHRQESQDALLIVRPVR